MDTWVTLLELVVLVALLVTLGPVVSAFLNVWGVLLVVGVFVAGLLLPLLLHWRRNLLGGSTLAAAAVLALLGGFVLRVVIVMASERV